MITIRSLLDNKPYLHEPHQKDNPNYNDYVRYNTWRYLLIDYLEREQDPDAKKFLTQFVHKNGDEMIKELEQQKNMYGSYSILTSPYKRGSPMKPDYDALLVDLKNCVSKNRDYIQSGALVEKSPSETEQRKRTASDDVQ